MSDAPPRLTNVPQTTLATLAIVLPVVGAVFWFVISDLQRQLDETKVAVALKLDRNVYDGFIVANLAADTERDHQVHSLEDKIVPARENEGHWQELDALKKRVEGLSDRMCAPKGP